MKFLTDWFIGSALLAGVSAIMLLLVMLAMELERWLRR